MTRAATVRAVVRRGVPLEEALARMRMFLLTLEAASDEAPGPKADGVAVTFPRRARHTE